MKLVHLQPFKGGIVVEGIEMKKGAGFFLFLNNKNVILLQDKREE